VASRLLATGGIAAFVVAGYRRRVLSGREMFAAGYGNAIV
jgi:hypothetical protein